MEKKFQVSGPKAGQLWLYSLKCVEIWRLSARIIKFMTPVSRVQSLGGTNIAIKKMYRSLLIFLILA